MMKNPLEFPAAGRNEENNGRVPRRKGKSSLFHVFPPWRGGVTKEDGKSFRGPVSQVFYT